MLKELTRSISVEGLKSIFQNYEFDLINSQVDFIQDSPLYFIVPDRLYFDLFHVDLVKKLSVEFMHLPTPISFRADRNNKNLFNVQFRKPSKSIYYGYDSNENFSFLRKSDLDKMNNYLIDKGYLFQANSEKALDFHNSLEGLIV